MALGAADLQKQGQALVSEFGKGGAKVVTDFAEGSASSLGITARAAEQVGNRFGILFGQLGIGKVQAAQMTVNLEQLVGAISQIRNVDPSRFFQQIPLALQGNLRSLRQLGISTDALTIKNRALALGLISSTTQALTPTAKAQAIYSLATDHLSQLLQQAQGHSGDFANELRKLKAEFQNQIDALGKGLLPALANLGGILIQVLPGAFAGLKTVVVVMTGAIKGLYDILNTITGPFGGAKTAIEALITVLVAKKVIDFAQAITRSLIPAAKGAGTASVAAAAQMKTGLAEMATNANVATKEVLTSFNVMKDGVLLDVKEVDAAVASSLGRPTTGNVKTVTSAQARQRQIQNLATGGSVIGGGQQLRSQTSGRFAAVRPAFSGGGESFLLSKQVDADAPKVKTAFSGIAKAATASANATKAAWSPIGGAISKGLSTGVATTEAVLTGFKGFAIATAESIKLAFISALPILALTIAVQLIIEHFGLIKKVFFEVVHGIEGSWDGLKEVLIGTAKIIGGSVATYLTYPLRIFLEALNTVTGVLSAIGIHIGGQVKAALSDLKAISTGAVADGVKQAKEGGEKIAAAFSGAFNNSSPDGKGGIADKTKVATELTVSGLSANLQSVADAIKKGVQVNSDAVANARSRLKGLGVQLAQAITQENLDVHNAVESAKSNTLSLANTLADSIGQLLQAPLDRSNAKIQQFMDQRSLTKLRQSIFLPGGKTLSADPDKALAELRTLAKNSSTVSKGAIQDYILQYQQATNQVKQDQINNTKQQTQARLSTLAAELNSHKITLKQFHAGVLAVLKKDKIPYQEAGAYLGKAFLAGFHQQTKDLFAQALQVTKAGGLKQGAGTTGFNADIVKPLVTLHNDQVRVQTIQREIVTAERSLNHAIAAQAKKQLAATDKQIKLHTQQVLLQTQLNELLARAQRERAGGAAARHQHVANKTAADLAGTSGG